MQPRLALLLALGLGGCSAMLDTSTQQCSIDADCTRLGGGLGAVCTAGVCVAPAADVRTCKTHKDCPQQPDAPGFCTPANTCQPLFTPECNALWPRNALDDLGQSVTLVGFMAATTGNGKSYGLPQVAGAQQALSEIQRGPNGFPPIGDVGVTRRFAMLICDQQSWAAATDHLVKALRLPAIVGASYSGVTQKVFYATGGANTLVFSPAATSPSLTTIDDRGLLWRTPPIDTLQVEALKLVYARVAAALTGGTQQQASSPTAVATPQTLRVAVTIKGETAGESLYDVLLQRAKKEDVVNPADPIPVTLTPILYPDPDQGQPDWDQVVATLVASKPHIIVALGTNEFVTQAMAKLESAWPGGVPRPWYLMPEGNRVSELLALARDRPELDLPSRVIGTAPGNRSSPAFAAFAGRFRAEPSNMGAAPGNLAEYAYDAMYLLAYATAITKKAAPSGLDLAQALAKTTGCDQNKVQPGPQGFLGSFSGAARVGCADYTGVSGDFDWNVDRGEAPSDFDVWCLVDNGGAFAFEPPVSQYLYKTGALRDPALDLSRPGWCRRPGG